ncbi:kelch repeat protein [Ostertagia ostertagi]
MDGWCAESDCPPRRSTRSPERDRTVHHFVNDRLSGEFFHNLTHLRRNDELCDVVIEASGPIDAGGAESESSPPTIIAAHKVVLAAACPYFILLIESEELLTMDESSFIQLISDDRLTTEGEEAVFEAAINWVKYDLSRKPSLPKVLAAVRLPLISQEFLLDRAYQEPLIQESPACIAMLCSVYHHILKKEVTPGLAASWIRPRQPVPLSQLVMLVGGQAPKAISNVDTFDPDSQRWSSLASLQQRRCRCGVVMAGDLVYAIGGFNGTARIRSVEIYDPRRVLLFCLGQWMALPSMTTRRSSVGVAAMNGIVYAVGGYDGQSRQCLNTVSTNLGFVRRRVIRCTCANRWRSGESLLEVRSGAGVAIYRDRVITAGGHDGPLVRSSVSKRLEFSSPIAFMCERGFFSEGNFIFSRCWGEAMGWISCLRCPFM